MDSSTTSTAGRPSPGVCTAQTADRRAAPEQNTFLARHPIFDMDKRAIGYELLFRNSDENNSPAHDPTAATLRTIHSALHVIGLEPLLGGKTLFLNITAQILLDESYIVLPADQTVLELEATAADTTDAQALLDACGKARRSGYMLALDNHQPGTEACPLLEVADIIKIDYPRTGYEACRALLERMQGRKVAMLASRIESNRAFEQAVELGFDYIQGFFFCEPEMLRSRTIDGAETIRLRFLAELARPELDFEQIETVIKSDTVLTYSLLKYLNSPACGIRNRVTSIHQALVLLGERPLRRWGALVAVAAMSGNKPGELLITSLVRARFCESLAPMCRLQERSLDLFLIGLLSTLDAITDIPMAQALMALPLDDEVRQVLLGDHTGPLGDVYALAHASERGAWGTAGAICGRLHLVQHEVVKRYYDSLRWVHDLFR